MLLEKIAMNVPKKAYSITVPRFLKKGFFYKLYPLSNIIGGSRRIMNSISKCTDKSVMYFSTSISLRTAPAAMPINTVRPASCKYLCPLFFRICPKVIASITRKSMINISTEKSAYKQVLIIDVILTSSSLSFSAN
jgi:hypothetical protein